MSSGMNFGVRASVPHLLGICFGVPVLMAAIGFGAGTLFQLVPWSHTAIKILGLSYLFYLAYRIATSAPDSLEGGRSRPFTFFEAALFQWINPKAWMMGISAIGTYTSVGMAMAPQVALMVLVFFLFTWPSAGVWLFFGAGLKRILGNPRHQRWFNWTMAALLVFSMKDVAQELVESAL